MSYTAPTLFFGQGLALEFSTLLALPAAVYQTPNAVALTLENFNGALKNSLRTLQSLAQNAGVDASAHIAAVAALIDAQLVTDKAFVNAFVANVTVNYGLNFGDDSQSIALYVIVQIGAVSRQFFHSTVQAHQGTLPGSRTYGNARDVVA